MLALMGKLNSRLGAALMVVAALTLAGCAGETSEVAPEPTPTEAEVVAASENEVTSVIAEYEPDWRETIDGAGGCRFDWVMNPGQISNMSCYLQEQTMTITAQLVVRDWGEMVIPESMSGIVDDTTAVLEKIGAVDLKAACGEEAEPNDTDECSTALGTLNVLYGQLEGELNSWSPYL